MLDLGVTTSYGNISVNAYHSNSGSATSVHDDNESMNSVPIYSSAGGMAVGATPVIDSSEKDDEKDVDTQKNNNTL